MQCSECGTEFSALREFCPKCGASSDPAVQARRRASAEPRPDNTKRNRVLLIGAGLLASLAVVGNVFDGGFGFDHDDRREQVAESTANAAVEIEADALYLAYREDARAADRRFDGREMVVTGEFLRIVPDGWGSLDLRLKTSNPDVPVGIDVADLALEDAKRLQPGDRVTVSCQRMGGHEDELWVRDCAIQSVEGGTAAAAAPPPAAQTAPTQPAAPNAPQAPAAADADAND